MKKKQKEEQIKLLKRKNVKNNLNHKIMKKLIILLVLFTTSLYGQKFKSYSYSYAHAEDTVWGKPIEIETNISVDFENDKIIFSNFIKKIILTEIHFDETFLNDEGFEVDMYFCKNQEGLDVEFYIQKETSIKNQKIIFLGENYLATIYDLYIQEND